MKKEIYKSALHSANEVLGNSIRGIYHHLICFSFRGEFFSLGKLLDEGEQVPMSPAYFTGCKDPNAREMITMMNLLNLASEKLEKTNGLPAFENKETGSSCITSLDPYPYQISKLPVHLFFLQVGLYVAALHLLHEDNPDDSAALYEYASDVQCNTDLLDDSSDRNVSILKDCILEIERTKRRIYYLNGLTVDARYFLPCDYIMK